MPYVQIPKDLNQIKEKTVGKFTKRQATFFGIGAVIGLIGFFVSKKLGVELTTSVFIIVILAMPCMFFGMYEKDGLMPEQILKRIIKTKIIYPQIRLYKTENIYEDIIKQIEINKEVELLEPKKHIQKKKANKTSTKKKK